MSRCETIKRWPRQLNLLVRIGLVDRWQVLGKALKPLPNPQFLRESRKTSF